MRRRAPNKKDEGNGTSALLQGDPRANLSVSSLDIIGLEALVLPPTPAIKNTIKTKKNLNRKF